jgi:transposase
MVRREAASVDRASSDSVARVHSKKKSVLALERDSERVQAARATYQEAVAKIPRSRLVFVDETGTHVALTRTHSWTRCGTRATGLVPLKGNRLKLTVAGAIALDGVRCLMAYEGGTTNEAFQQFVDQALVPSLRQGDVVVMDNLQSHKAAAVRDSIEAAGATLLFQPPYHPDLNPIELTWSKLKNTLRKLEARTLDTLVAAIDTARERITPQNIDGWFNHCGYPQCI